MEIERKKTYSVVKTANYYDRAWANDLLKYAIKVCQGKMFSSPLNVRFSCLIRLHRNLIDQNYMWHGKILNYHIHAFQQRNISGLQSPQGLTTTKRDRRVSKSDTDVLVWYPHLPHGLGGEL